MGEKAIKGKAITKVLGCLVVFVILMSVFSVAVVATNSVNSTASNVNVTLNDNENSSAKSMRIMPSGNSDLSDASNTSSLGIINESDEVPDPNLPVINDTDIDTATAKTVSSTSSCDYVWIKITDKYCKGYKVYVDGKYELKEDGDGYCHFTVTPGYHTFKLTLDGKEVSKGWNCQCGHVYNWMSMNEMDPHWCEDGNDNEVKFRGEVTYDSNTLGAGTYIVTVDEVLYDPQDYFKWSGDAEVNWGIWNDGPYVENADVGDKVEVFGRYTKYDDGIHVVDLETSSHYLKKIDSGSLSIDVWTADASKNTKTEFEPGGNIYIWVKTNRPVTIDLIVDIYYDTGEHTQKYLRDDKRLSAANEYYNVWTAGEPGRRVLTLKAWDDYGNHAEDKWTFHVKGDQGDCSSVVNFKGTATANENKVEGFICYGSYHCKVKIEELLSNPGNKLKAGNEYIVCYGDSPKNIKTGDKLEVYGEYFHTCGPLQYVGHIIAFKSEHVKPGKDYYIKKIEKPDLIIQDIYWSPSNPKQGDTVSINVKTKNQGSGNAGGFYVCYYVDGSYYDRDYVSSLSAGSTTTTSFTWTADCGSHSIKAVADCYDAITESDENNNRRIETLNIPCKPDLIVQDISWDKSNPKQEDTITFTVKIKNQGSGKAKYSYAYYYIDGAFIDYNYVPPLSTGAISTQTFTWTANKCGNVQVKAIADKDSDVDESNENNNERVESINIKCPPKKPDLVIQDISWSPSSPKMGDTVTINVKTKNKGSESAGGFYVCYYVDGSYYTRDYVSSLSAGSTTTTSFTWTADCGNHAIKAVADCYDAVTESDEENNWMSKGGLNIPCKPDLIIQDISLSPSNPKEGETVTFTIKTKNQGSENAGGFYVGYYVDGSYYDRDYVGSLSAGSTATTSFTTSLTWTVDEKGCKCGSILMKTVADCYNAVAESNETNNDYSYQSSITYCIPDLIIQDISWDKNSPEQGDTVTFTVKIKNQGSESAGSSTSTVKYYINGSYVTSDSVPSLSAGSTSTQTFTWKANKCGNVQVKAVADATNAVDESNEGNNQRIETVNIGCPKIPAFESKGIYVWGFSTEFFKNENERERFFNLIKNDGIKTTFLSIDESLFADPACKEFVKEANENLQVHAMIGANWSEGDADKIDPFVRAVLKYNAENPDYMFSGIHLDAEPGHYPLKDFLGEYKEKLIDMKTRLNYNGETISSQKMALSIDVGCWWANEPNDLKDLIGVPDLDYITIMAYGDDATDIIELANKVTSIAQEKGKPFVISLETQEGVLKDGDFKPDQPVTFFEEGQCELQQELEKLEENYKDDELFKGFAIHYYQSSFTPWHIITDVIWPSGEFNIGDSVKVIVKLRTSDNFNERPVGIGLSVRDKKGNVYPDDFLGLGLDKDTSKIILMGGKDEKEVELTWRVPEVAEEGWYDITVAAWDIDLNEAELHESTLLKNYPEVTEIGMYKLYKMNIAGLRKPCVELGRRPLYDSWREDQFKVCIPDLIIQDISWDKNSPKRDDTITFYVKVKNQGSGSAGTSTVKYYIDGSYVDSDTVPELSAGSTFTQTFTWTANKCGDVKIKAVADATNAVAESNEGNNARTETVNIICLYLEKIWITGPDEIKAGETLQWQAYGSYSDGSQKELTNQVSWTVDASDILQNIGNGKFKGLKGGEATLKIDYEGKSASKKVTVIEKENQPPKASFTYEKDGLTVRFTSTSYDPDGDIEIYNWFFGDGGTLNQKNPIHTYSIEGTYIVVLLVRDDKGAVDAYYEDVTIIEPKLPVVIWVDNVNDAPLPACGGEITVKAYKELGDIFDDIFENKHIAEKTVLYEGGSPFSVVSMSVPKGAKFIRVWQKPKDGIKEYWGSAEISPPGVISFTRHTPWLYDIDFDLRSPYTQYINMDVNNEKHIDTTVSNPESTNKKVKVELILDRDMEKPYDFDDIGPKDGFEVSSGETDFVTFRYTPREEGIWKFRVVVQTLYDDKYWVVTDQHAWYLILGEKPIGREISLGVLCTYYSRVIGQEPEDVFNEGMRKAWAVYGEEIGEITADAILYYDPILGALVKTSQNPFRKGVDALINFANSAMNAWNDEWVACAIKECYVGQRLKNFGDTTHIETRVECWKSRDVDKIGKQLINEGKMFAYFEGFSGEALNSRFVSGETKEKMEEFHEFAKKEYDYTGQMYYDLKGYGKFNRNIDPHFSPQAKGPRGGGEQCAKKHLR